MNVWWAGLGRTESFQTLIGRAALRPVVSKFDGRGRVAAHRLEILIGRAGPRPKRFGLYMGRPAESIRRPIRFHGPARAAAYEMWCTVAAIICTMTKATLPMRWPTRFCGPARAAAHDMLFAVSTTMATSTPALAVRGNQPAFTGRRETGRSACNM